MKLYELTNAILDAQHDEMNPGQLDSLQMAFEEKVIGCACVVKNLNAEVAAVDSEIQRLINRKRQIEANRDNLKGYVLHSMQVAGIEKVSNGVHRVRRQRNPLSVVILDEDRVPFKFKEKVVTVKIDRKGIVDWVKETGELPEGCEVKQDEHLRIS